MNAEEANAAILRNENERLKEENDNLKAQVTALQREIDGLKRDLMEVAANLKAIYAALELDQRQREVDDYDLEAAIAVEEAQISLRARICDQQHSRQRPGLGGRGAGGTRAR